MTIMGIRHLSATAAIFLITAPCLSAQQVDQAHSKNAPIGNPLPIFYEPALVAKGFPSPLIKARIAGHEALFLIDSGASVNVFADWYARLAKIPTETASDGSATGSGGKTTTVRTTHHVQGYWSDGRRFVLREAIVVAFPPLFEALHLGGLLSPQLLAPAGTATVLDLKTPSLEFKPFARAMSELHLSQTIAMPQRVCINPGSKFVNRLYLTPVTTAGVTESVLIDTGATKTIFSIESDTAHAIEAHSEPGPRSEGIGGDVNGRRIVPNAKLLRGNSNVTLNPSIGVVSSSCDAKGILGMDALRSCLLILGDSEIAFSCD